MASGRTKFNTERVTDGVLAPGKVIAQDISAAGVYVKEGSLCRIRVSSATFVAFGLVDIAAVSVTTDPGLELPVAGTYLVVATGDYIRASANAARLEVL